MGGGRTGDSLMATVQAFFFPALLQINNVRILGGSLWMWALALIIPNAGLWLFAVLAAADVEGAAALYGISWLAFFCVGVALRLQVREKLDIGGTFLGDLCSWMWCGPASAYQEYMALQENQVSSWGSFIVMKSGIKKPSQAIMDEEL